MSMIDARVVYWASVAVFVINVSFCVSAISAYLIDMKKVFGFFGGEA
jgi:ABC-type polysaccharide/polyol phosphate export permease